MTRRLPALAAMSLASLLAVSACGSGGGSGSGETTTAGTGSSATSSTKACLVSDVGRFNDKGFNQLQFQGLKRAASELGVATKALESRAAGDYIPNLSSCARAGNDVTIAAGFLLADPLAKVAKQFPDQSFAITDYSVKGPPFNGKEANVAGLTYATQENGYLAGCMSALMTKKQGGKQVIGAVGGVKIPPVDTYIAGYQAGAEKCSPGIKVLVGYSQDFVDQAKCKTVAENQIAAGSQVEFNVAGGCGLGTLDAAKGAGVWGIGVDTDQAFLGAHILTSAVKRVDNGVFTTVQDVAKDRFKGGGDLVFDLKNGGVGLGKTSAKVTSDIRNRVDDLRKQIVDGEITPPTAVKGG
jgi:basic membrane protein A and related proteins